MSNSPMKQSSWGLVKTAIAMMGAMALALMACGVAGDSPMTQDGYAERLVDVTKTYRQLQDLEAVCSLPQAELDRVLNESSAMQAAIKRADKIEAQVEAIREDKDIVLPSKFNALVDRLPVDEWAATGHLAPGLLDALEDVTNTAIAQLKEAGC